MNELLKNLFITFPQQINRKEQNNTQRTAKGDSDVIHFHRSLSQAATYILYIG